jgi:hypothetical protein
MLHAGHGQLVQQLAASTARHFWLTSVPLHRVSLLSLLMLWPSAFIHNSVAAVYRA